MKIAFPVEKDNGLNSDLYGHFGSAPFFVIADDGDGSLEAVANGQHGHAHGQCQPTAGLVERQVKAVVCAGMGMRAVQKLNEIGISVYLAADARTVGEALAAFKAGRLPLFQPGDACRHHHGCH
ncbi:MAG: NifB/NifX family molybdenum-iron cluster-binding protein [Acidobacteria bacterium]|jgi:predicted Fe-Mo cluster-binding NifX family protein|nr:NifB/NifX family molybdenum-iron cluster-binding protein [Acidobacteriota bacterium]